MAASATCLPVMQPQQATELEPEWMREPVSTGVSGGGCWDCSEMEITLTLHRHVQCTSACACTCQECRDVL